MTRKVVTLLEDLCTFIPVSFLVIILIRNVSGKGCRENKTQILRSVTFSENRAIYGTMRKKCDRARQDHKRKYNKTHALCVQDN